MTEVALSNELVCDSGIHINLEKRSFPWPGDIGTFSIIVMMQCMWKMFEYVSEDTERGV